MEKIWLKSYPAGVPEEIDETRYNSLSDLLEESFREHRSKCAFVCMGKAITYGELDTLSTRLAAWLQSRGLKTGARVAIMMPNVLQYPVAIAAILRAGYVVVNVNPLYTPRELEHQLRDSGAEAIVVLENFAHTVQAVAKNTAIKHVVVGSMGDLMGAKGVIVNFVVRHVKKLVPAWTLPGHVSFNAALRQGARETLKPIKQGPDDIAFLQYTGGTTGVAKGAMLLHRNLIANVLQSEVWLDPGRKNRPDIDQFVTVVALPLYHIFALTVCGFLTLRTGGMGILIPNPRDIPGTIKELKGFQINTFPAVNTLYNALLNNPEFAKLDFSKLIAANGLPITATRLCLLDPADGHTHEFFELGLLTGGSAIHMSEAGTTPLRAGRLVVVGPGGWHAYWPDLALYLVSYSGRDRTIAFDPRMAGSLGGIGYLLDTSCPPTLPGVIVADLDQAVTEAISPTISLPGGGATRYHDGCRSSLSGPTARRLARTRRAGFQRGARGAGVFSREMTSWNR